ncbi:MAG: hypothetical protein J6S69_11300 [Proteobacteria bacterium]|nr:hypothetical protein [Pseudomonadota bacterium]
MTTESHLNQDDANSFTSDAPHVHDDDSIEFGTDVATEDIISFHKDNPPDLTKDPYEDEDLQAPVCHRAESTLLNDSPLLKLIEEVNGERSKRKTPHGLIISCIFLGILAIVGGTIAVIGMNENKEAQEAAAQKAEAFVPVPVLERTWYNYEITPQNVDVLINGVAMKTMEIPPEHAGAVELPLVTRKTNMVSFFHEGYVPFSDMVSYDRDFEESPLNYEMMDDAAFLHSKLVIKAPKNAKPGETIIYVNGQPYVAEENVEVHSVSGFPYFIHVQQKGFGDHLHVVWPIRNPHEIELPALQLQNNADRRTALTVTVPRDYLTDNSFTLDVFAEDQHTNKPGVRHIAKGELIEIKMRKDGRYPLDLILDSTPFGSIVVEPYMQLASLGVATLKFDKKTAEDVTVCFRRASEAICTDIQEKNMIPSGKWEMVAYRMEGDQKVWFKNAPYETLQPDTEYTLMVTADDTFDYKLTSKKPKKKK